jgi:predicted  nucleic acid-binding Zn-ribbon protein
VVVEPKTAAVLVKTCARCGGSFPVAPRRKHTRMCPACSCASYLESTQASAEARRWRKARLRAAKTWR